MDHPRLARDIMVTKLVTLTTNTNVFDGIARLLKYNLTGASVIDEHRNYLGVFSERCCISVLMATAHLLASRNVRSPDVPRAKDLMATKLITLTPDMDVFEAIHLLLKNRISGAPVIDKSRQFLGSFSEKTSMTVLLGAAHDQLPTSRVEAFMDKDRSRAIDEEKSLLSIAQMFLDTPYRRLAVLRDGALIGQISRRDVLRASHSMSPLHNEPPRRTGRPARPDECKTSIGERRTGQLYGYFGEDDRPRCGSAQHCSDFSSD